jgi:hypothetical protein
VTASAVWNWIVCHLRSISAAIAACAAIVTSAYLYVVRPVMNEVSIVHETHSDVADLKTATTQQQAGMDELRKMMSANASATGNLSTQVGDMQEDIRQMHGDVRALIGRADASYRPALQAAGPTLDGRPQ